LGLFGFGSFERMRIYSYKFCDTVWEKNIKTAYDIFHKLFQLIFKSYLEEPMKIDYNIYKKKNYLLPKK
jgi:hypothetical protein